MAKDEHVMSSKSTQELNSSKVISFSDYSKAQRAFDKAIIPIEENVRRVIYHLDQPSPQHKLGHSCQSEHPENALSLDELRERRVKIFSPP